MTGRPDDLIDDEEARKQMDVRIQEQNLPGVGRRYEMPLADDRLLIVVVQREGARQVAFARPDEDDVSAAVTLTEDQAIAFASLLTGARFSIETAHVAGRSRDVSVETVTLDERSPAIGQLVADVSLTPDSDAVILAVIRDDTPQLLEDAETEPVRPGDRVVVAARRDRLEAVVRDLAG